jgi:hypothetical protein
MLILEFLDVQHQTTFVESDHLLFCAIGGNARKKIWKVRRSDTLSGRLCDACCAHNAINSRRCSQVSFDSSLELSPNQSLRRDGIRRNHHMQPLRESTTLPQPHSHTLMPHTPLPLSPPPPPTVSTTPLISTSSPRARSPADTGYRSP